MNTQDLASLPRNTGVSRSRQLSFEIEEMIRQHAMESGARLPTVRDLAQTFATSTHTVAEAYTYLVARGVVLSRRGSGYFVAKKTDQAPFCDNARSMESFDPRHLGREILSDSPIATRLGGGSASPEWTDYIELESAVRKISRNILPRFGSYGTTQGYAPLREALSRKLSTHGIKAPAASILLTHGATQAIDLVIRLLVKPGQIVMVDDPGYFQTSWALKSQGAKVIGIPRNADGPDVVAFERICSETKSTIFFTQSALQNPTGSVMSLSTAHHLLRIAEKHAVTLVEDDVSADLTPESTPRLAMLDQLTQVIYVGSFSKTLSPSLRVGFLSTNRADYLQGLASLKLISCYASCESNEAIIHSLLSDGHYARHVRRLERRLKERAATAIPRLEALGFEIAQPYFGGSFVWMKHRSFNDAMTLTDHAASQGILLAPGCAFRPNQEISPYFRFSLPLCTDSAINLFKRVLTQLV